MAIRGTTANVLMIADNKLICANAGDSRCIVGANKKALALSEDHKPTDPIEKERIEAAGYTVSEEGRIEGILNLSRCLGDYHFKRNRNLELEDQAVTSLPDVKTTSITEKTDFVVLALIP